MNSLAASPFKNVFKKAELEFDYETNFIRLDEKDGMESKLYIQGTVGNSESKIVD